VKNNNAFLDFSARRTFKHSKNCEFKKPNELGSLDVHNLQYSLA